MKANCVWLARGTGRGLLSSDEAIPMGAEPPSGAHNVTPRRSYIHHGIYIGPQECIYPIELVAESSVILIDRSRPILL